MSAGDLERAQVAQCMIAQDARWIGDALLSTSNFPRSSSAIAMALIGHSSRIVYEAGQFVRGAGPKTGLATLAELLPDEFSTATERARHATKLLDDNKKSVRDLGRGMDRWLSVHQSEFLGNSHRFVRFLETDLGLFDIDRHLLIATVAVQFRLGAEPGTGLKEFDRFASGLAEEQGASLTVLATTSGDTTPISATQNYSTLGSLTGRDLRSDRYLARRYDPQLPTQAKLILLLAEGEVTATDRLLPLTEGGHEEAAFRARFITLFHALSAVAALLETHASAKASSTDNVRTLLATADAQWMLGDRGSKRLRNQCVHYGVRGKDVALDYSAPMFGLVPALTGGRSYEEVDGMVVRLARQFSDTMQRWQV